MYEHELGVRYSMWQGEHSRTFGNHEGARGQQLEWRNHAGTCKVNTFTSKRDLELGETGSLRIKSVPTS